MVEYVTCSACSGELDGTGTCPNDCLEPFPPKYRFATQGGGYCTWDESLKCYVWESDIPDFLGPNVRVGDPIPEEWGVAGPVEVHNA